MSSPTRSPLGDVALHHGAWAATTASPARGRSFDATGAVGGHAVACGIEPDVGVTPPGPASWEPCVGHVMETSSGSGREPLYARSPQAADQALMATKLARPRVPPTYVPRAHLDMLLDDGTLRPLTVLSAG